MNNKERLNNYLRGLCRLHPRPERRGFTLHMDKVDEIARAFTLLLGLDNVKVNHPERLALAITWHKQGLDFADALHLANSQHCKILYTFDKKMITKAKQLEGCKVLAPD